MWRWPTIICRWNGADTNPNNNDGQGNAGSDRNNVLLLRNKNYPEGTGLQYGPAPTYGHYGNNYPAYLNQSHFLGLSQQDLLKLAFLEPGNWLFSIRLHSFYSVDFLLHFF